MLKFFRWLFRDRKWIDIPAGDPFTSMDHGTHHFEFVSRHAIAESGLHCPLCRNEVAPVGDFRLVRRCRLGEVIRCNGTRNVNDEDVPCPAYLIASPDTEHGDHLIFDFMSESQRKKKFYTFVRIKEEAAVCLKHGDDAIMRAGEVYATGVAPKPAVPTHSDLKPFVVGQLWQTSDGRQFVISRVQGGDDPVFQGWAWGNFLNETAYDWHVDRTGLIRQTMRDPTLSDKIRLVTDLRPI